MEIEKIIYSDGTEEDNVTIESLLENFDIDDILKAVGNDAIEDYAESWIEMFRIGDIRSKELIDFTDEEIINHCNDYGIVVCPISNPVAQEIYNDMMILFDKYSLPDLSNIVTHLINHYNINIELNGKF